MTPVLMAVCLLTGVLTGLLAGGKWRRSLRRQLAEERSRIDMWNTNALATDHDVIGGPVTPAKGTVELYDQDSLNDMRWRLNEQADCPEAGGCRRPEQCETGCYWRRLDALNRPLGLPPISENDIDVMRAGFRGYDGCPSGDCTTPFQCSERGDCRRWPEAVGADDAVRCADGGVCAYVSRGMASCDDQCAVSLADDDEAREFLAEIRRSPVPVEDDTPKVSD